MLRQNFTFRLEIKHLNYKKYEKTKFIKTTQDINAFI